MTAKVVVIGAGVTGLASACELARRGAEVTIIEKDHVGFEASSRNMGAIGVLGKHAAEIAAASVGDWAELNNRFGREMGFVQRGRLYVAHDRTDLHMIEEMTQHANEQDLDVVMLSAEEVKKRFPFVQVETMGAAFSSKDAQVEPERVVAVFRQMAIDLGVEIREQTLVRGIDVRSGKVAAVQNETGELRCDLVLLTAGVWAYRLLDRVGIHIPFQVLELFHGQTTPQPPVCDIFLRGPDYGARQTQSGAVRFSGGYRILGVRHALALHDLRDIRVWGPRLWQRRAAVQLRLEPSLNMFEIRSALRLAPVAPKGFDPRVPMGYIGEKFRRLKEVLPSLANAGIASAWGGLIDLTPDLLPVLGAIDSISGLFVAIGFSGQGFGASPVIGRLMADVMFEQVPDIDLEPYHWSRFRNGNVAMPKHLM
jgi:glycine/D-amino acid oxidase-like deaminating enzyme